MMLFIEQFKSKYLVLIILYLYLMSSEAFSIKCKNFLVTFHLNPSNVLQVKAKNCDDSQLYSYSIDKTYLQEHAHFFNMHQPTQILEQFKNNPENIIFEEGQLKLLLSEPINKKEYISILLHKETGQTVPQSLRLFQKEIVDMREKNEIQNKKLEDLLLIVKNMQKRIQSLQKKDQIFSQGREKKTNEFSNFPFSNLNIQDKFDSFDKRITEAAQKITVQIRQNSKDIEKNLTNKYQQQITKLSTQGKQIEADLNVKTNQIAALINSNFEDLKKTIKIQLNTEEIKEESKALRIQLKTSHDNLFLEVGNIKTKLSMLQTQIIKAEIKELTSVKEQLSEEISQLAKKIEEKEIKTHTQIQNIFKNYESLSGLLNSLRQQKKYFPEQKKNDNLKNEQVNHKNLVQKPVKKSQEKEKKVNFQQKRKRKTSEAWNIKQFEQEIDNKSKNQEIKKVPPINLEPKKNILVNKNAPTTERNFQVTKKPPLPKFNLKQEKIENRPALKPYSQVYKGADKHLVEQLQRQICKCPFTTFNDIAELQHAKKLLNQAVLLPKILPQYFKGIRKAMKSILFLGPPGTGKTLLAQAVATNNMFFNISASSLASKWKGDSEKMVRLLFEMARYHSPSVIFFDEIDSIATKRSQKQDESTRKVKNQLLVQMDGVGNSNQSVFVIAATNRPWDLDQALRRRLQKRIYIPLPGDKGRKKMFQINLKQLKVSDNINWDKVIEFTKGCSGADIRNICKDAAHMELRKKLQEVGLEKISDIFRKGQLRQQVTQANLIQAAKKIKPSVGNKELINYQNWMNEFGSS